MTYGMNVSRGSQVEQLFYLLERWWSVVEASTEEQLNDGEMIS